MKKKLSILLAVVFCLTLFPLTAAADDPTAVTYYDLWVGGEQVTSAKLSGEGWSYSSENQTLTLDGYNYTGAGHQGQTQYPECGAIYIGIPNLVLVVKGTNTVKETGGVTGHYCSNGIVSAYGLTITGSGTLNAIGGIPIPRSDSHGQSRGIRVMGKLTVDKNFTGTLNAQGSAFSNSGNTDVCHGLAADEIAIYNGTVVAKAGDISGSFGQSIGIATSSATIYGGNVTAIGGKPSGSTYSYGFGRANLTVSGGTVTLIGDTNAFYYSGRTLSLADGATASGSTNTSGDPLEAYEAGKLSSYKFITITASPQNPTTFTVTLVGNNESKEYTVEAGSDFELPTCGFNAPAGKLFKAWSIAGVEKKPGDKIEVTSDTTITAVWEDVPASAETFTVTFDTLGYGVAPSAQTVVKGEKATKPDNPVSDPLTFDGWKIIVDGSEKDYDFDTPVEKDITLIARWLVPTSPSYVTANWSTEIKRVELTYNDTPDVTVYETDAVISWTVIQEATSTSSGKILYKGTAEGRDGIEFTEEWIEIIPPLSGSSDWIRKSLAMGAALFNPPKKQTGSRLPEPEKQPDPVIVTVDAETPAIADEPAEPEIPFVDAAPGDPYYTAIVYAFKSGLMKGISDTEFGPSGTLNRAMFVTILGRLDMIDPADYTGCPFKDCEPLGDWDYLPYVAWAAEKGIVLGFGDGTFRPFDPVTNEQAVLMLRRYADYLGRETAAPEIAYEGASPWASAAVAWAFADGIYPTETDAPFTSPAERGWTARAFYNLVGFLTK